MVKYWSFIIKYLCINTPNCFGKNRIDNVRLVKGPRADRKGSIAITGHHFIFSAESSSKEDELWLLHRAIDRAIFQVINPMKATLTLKCKNFMVVVFEVPNNEDSLLVSKSIEDLSNLSTHDHDYPFYFRCSFQILDNGWNIFDINEQYTNLAAIYPEMFRLTSVNKNFQVCQSYPEVSLVFKGIGDDFLRISATYREGGRFPVVSYVDPAKHTVLVRTSQPLIGPLNRRCSEDESVLTACLGKNQSGLLFDTRNTNLAQFAKTRGGGSENPFYYRAWTIIFLDLPSITDLQQAFGKVVDACNNTNVAYHPNAYATKWLTYLSTVLNKAGVIAQSMYYHYPGLTHLVHDGEGTDLTLLMTSLCAIIIDPDSRTIRGFQRLIEREWILGGHQFAKRCAHSAYAIGTWTAPDESPVFLCFLNCVFHLLEFVPSAFEFNEQFLIHIFEHTYASEFGTFLFDNEAQRQRLGVRQHTVSLWSHVNHPDVLKSFMSAYFVPVIEPIWPVTAATSFNIWKRMFFRWEIDWKETDRVAEIAADLADRLKKLQREYVEKYNRSVYEAVKN